MVVTDELSILLHSNASCSFGMRSLRCIPEVGCKNISRITVCRGLLLVRVQGFYESPYWGKPNIMLGLPPVPTPRKPARRIAQPARGEQNSVILPPPHIECKLSQSVDDGTQHCSSTSISEANCLCARINSSGTLASSGEIVMRGDEVQTAAISHETSASH
jgi:hypothetical protein